MGCIKSKQKKQLNFNGDKSKMIDHLMEILEIIDIEKENLFEINSNKEYNIKRQRACYLAQLEILIKWTSKAIEVRLDERSSEKIVELLCSLVDSNDEYLLISLENKIKYLMNK